MTLRGNFKINKVDINATNKSQLDITLADGNANLLDKFSGFQNEADNKDVDTLRKTGGGDAANVTTNSNFQTLRIICQDEKEARKVKNLLELKNKIKRAEYGTDGNGADTNNAAEWMVAIEKIKYEVSGAETLLIDDGAGAAGDTTLTLKTSDFSGINNLNINNYTWAKDSVYKINDDFKDHRRRLFELEDKIDELEDYYKDETAALRDETNNINFLNTLATAKQATTPNIAKDIDHTLFQNFEVDGNQVYQKKIEDWLYFLRETQKWRQHANFTKVEQILQANANGFILEHTWNLTGNYNGAEVNYGTDAPNAIAEADLPKPEGIKGGKYKGFDIIEGARIAAAADNTTFDPANPLEVNPSKRSREIFGKNARVNKARYKLHIDNFYPAFKASIDAGKTSPKELRGFQPGDLAAGATDTDARFTASNINILSKGDDVVAYETRQDGTADNTKPIKKYKNEEITKLCFELLAETDPNEVIKKAFLENDFVETNEDRGALLEKYYNVARSEQMAVKYNGANDDAAKKWRGRVDKGHGIAKGLVDIIAKNPSNNEEYETWKGEFKKYISDKRSSSDDDEKRFGSYWDSSSKQDAIIDSKKPSQTPPNDKNVTAIQIDAARDGLTLTSKDDKLKNTLKSIFSDPENRTELQKHPKAFLDDLVALVILIDKAYTDGNNLDKSKLEAYSGTTGVSDDRKKMWKMVNNDRIKDEKGNKLGDHALTLAKGTGDNTAKLAAAIKKLKEAIKAALGKEDDTVYNNIVKGKSDNTTFIHGVAEIIEEATKILAGSDDNARQKLEEFNNKLKSIDGAEKAINDYLKKDNKGYVELVRAKGKKLDSELEKLVKDAKLDEVKNRKEAETKVNDFKNSDGYKKLTGTNKDLADERVIPWTLLLGALAENKEKVAKELVPVVQVLLKKPNIKTAFSDSEDNYKDLKGKLEKIESFKNSSEYGKLGADDKKAFDVLLEKVKERTNELAKKHDKTNTGDPDKPFWKTPLGIIGILASVALVIGLVAYLIKSNSSEEGEGESE